MLDLSPGRGVLLMVIEVLVRDREIMAFACVELFERFYGTN